MSEIGTNEFNQYCRDHGSWIIKYFSHNLPNPIYLIWYNNIINQNLPTLLTFNDGKIYNTNSVQNIIGLTTQPDIRLSEQLSRFISGLINFSSIQFTYFNISDLTKEIKLNSLTVEHLSWISDFIQLINDYLSNNHAPDHLKISLNDQKLQDTLKYYHEYIFWPSIQGRTVEPTVIDNIPANADELAIVLNRIIDAFDQCFS